MTLCKKMHGQNGTYQADFYYFAAIKLKYQMHSGSKNSKRPFYDLRQFVYMENRVQRELIDGPSLPSN